MACLEFFFLHVPLPDVGGLGCKNGALLVEFIGTSVALVIGVGVGLISHLRKRQFLSMILPDPSTQIWY